VTGFTADQSPGFASSVEPTCADPVTVGGLLITGGSGGVAMWTESSPFATAALNVPIMSCRSCGTPKASGVNSWVVPSSWR
jgi:hypothetical protein